MIQTIQPRFTFYYNLIYSTKLLKRNVKLKKLIFQNSSSLSSNISSFSGYPCDSVKNKAAMVPINAKLPKRTLGWI